MDHTHVCVGNSSEMAVHALMAFLRTQAENYGFSSKDC